MRGASNSPEVSAFAPSGTGGRRYVRRIRPGFFSTWDHLLAVANPVYAARS